MANEVRQTVMELLLKNVSPEEVALTVGCDVAYVLGLQSDPTFHTTLVQARTGQVIEKHDRDASIDTLETIALSRLVDTLPTETNTRVLIQAFNTLNGAKRRSQNEHRSQQGATVVELHMPAFITQQNVTFQKDHQGQVVSVGGRRLETIDTATLLEEASGESESIKNILADRDSMEQLSVDDL